MAELSDTTIFLAAGALLLPKLIDGAVGFARWSAHRNVESADKEKDKAEQEFDKLRELVSELGSDMIKVSAAHSAHKDMMTSALGGIDGRLVALDNRIAMQGKAYEERITEGFRKLEIELNRKLAQVLTDRRKPR